MSHGARVTVNLGVVLACVVGTMAIGAGSKAPCSSGEWSELPQYRLLCYTDVVPLLDTEQLRGSRLPFLDPCAPSELNCDEYPVVTMYVMRLAASIAGDQYTPFYWVNALLLTGFAVATAVMLYVANGSRALYFALAPTLLVYGTVNWDLVAVAFATGGLLAFFLHRDRVAGISLGLGAATKLYPALLVVLLAVQRLRERRPDDAIVMSWTAVGTWLLVNLPFAIVAPTAWFTFFRFNTDRPADFDSLWYIGCRHLDVCPSVRAINLLSLLLFLGSAAAVWAMKARRHPSFPRWSLGLPLLIVFLLTNKVYSPQYGLWLLPWFALTLPHLWTFVAFSLADVAVFATRFSWFGTMQGTSGATQGMFEAAVLVRTVVLVWCIVLWMRREPEPLEIERRERRRQRAAPKVSVA
ncbi:MAG: hypothetical protein ABWZ53_00630 [Actinomycetota bacterium]